MSQDPAAPGADLAVCKGREGPVASGPARGARIHGGFKRGALEVWRRTFGPGGVFCGVLRWGGLSRSGPSGTIIHCHAINFLPMGLALL